MPFSIIDIEITALTISYKLKENLRSKEKIVIKF